MATSNGSAENIGTVDESGQTLGGTGGGQAAEVNEMGLTAEEQAQFDAMQSGQEVEVPDADDGDDGDGDQGAIDDQAAAPAGDKTQTPADDQPIREGRRVSYNRFQREVQKRETAAATAAKERDEARAQAIRLEERLQMFAQAIQQANTQTQQAAPAAGAAPADGGLPSAADDPMPDPEEEIFKFAAWQGREMQRMQQKYDKQFETINQSTTQRQVQDEATQTRDNFRSDAQAFVGKQPDFKQAYDYLRDTRLVEIGLYLFNKDPSDPNHGLTEEEAKAIAETYNNEELWGIQNAHKVKQSAAERFYKLATLRGYKPQAQPKQNGAAAPKPNGQQQPRMPVPAQQPRSVVDEVNDLRQARADGRSLSDGGGTDGVPVAKTGADIARMNDDEFAAWLESVDKTGLESVLGR